MGVITFNGISSESLGIKVWTFPSYEVPEREVTFVHIPGRNGDLAIDQNAYKNVTRSYSVSLYDKNKTFTELANTIATWLHSGSGYCVLEDSYEPNYYRLAVYTEETTYSNVLNQAVTATINFNCKPQRFLKSGALPINITGSQTIINPESNVSKPELKINLTGTGYITINGVRITIVPGSVRTLYIDSELQDVYYYTGSGSSQTIHNGNSLVSFANRAFPVLNGGSNTIAVSGGITSVEVKPKWWTL